MSGKERPLFLQLVFSYAATEESQRGNENGVLPTQFSLSRHSEILNELIVVEFYFNHSENSVP